MDKYPSVCMDLIWLGIEMNTYLMQLLQLQLQSQVETFRKN